MKLSTYCFLVLCVYGVTITSVSATKHKSKNRSRHKHKLHQDAPDAGEKGEEKKEEGEEKKDEEKKEGDKKEGEKKKEEAPPMDGGDPALKGLNKAFPKNEPYLVGVEGWLRLSSVSFQDMSRFPPIPAPNATEEEPSLKIETIGPEGENLTEIQKTGTFRKNLGKEAPSEDSFYFRLSGKNLYYTESKGDMIVLGAMSIKNIQDEQGSSIHPDCFYVSSAEFDEWDLCTLKKEDKKLWFCAIFGLIHPKERCPYAEAPMVIEKIKIIKQPLILVPLPSPNCASDWNYNQHGMDWKCRCNEGIEQSPINLPRKDDAEPIRINALFDYYEVRKEDIKFIYDTNILRIVPKDDINLGTLTDDEGTQFQVSEVQFHTPAEHMIRNRKFDLEVMIIHKCVKGDYKMKAVLSILYKKKAGAKVRFFDELDILNLPNPLNRELDNTITGTFNIWKFLYDEEDLVRPPPFDYYKYHGSFTFPPCEEYVEWFVVAQPLNLSMTTISFLKDTILKPKVYGGSEPEHEESYPDNFDGNNREIQPLRERTVYYFDRLNSCNPYEPPKKTPKLDWHFEKVEKKAAKYYLVDGDQPSGIPGAYVVSEKEATGKLTPQMQINIGNYRDTDRYKIHRRRRRR